MLRPPSIQRKVLRRISSFTSSLTNSYRHASSKRIPSPSSVPKSTGGVKASKLGPRISPSYDASGARLSPMHNQRIFAAKKLYDHGIRNVYTAPSHFGKLGFSWLVATFFVGNTLRMLYEGFYKMREGHGLGTIKKTAVEAGNRLAMIFFTVVGGYAVLRFNGLIKTLDLVRTNNMVQLRISVRRAIPILKPKEYIVPSYSLRLPYKWRFHSEGFPDTAPRSTAQTAGRALSLPFRKFKEFLLMDGMLAVNFESIESGQIKALLDTNGKFTRNMGDLEAISNELQPWER